MQLTKTGLADCVPGRSTLQSDQSRVEAGDYDIVAAVANDWPALHVQQAFLRMTSEGCHSLA